MKLFNNIMLLFLFGFAFITQAEAQVPTTADDTLYSSRLVISPYAQAVPNDSYTFIGVTHPSLDSALTQIGLALEVVGMTTTVNNKAGRTAVFTVDAGETHRVFIANQGHSTINSSNTAFTDARTHIIPTADSAQFGAIRITSVSVRPELSLYEGTDVDGNVGRKFNIVPGGGTEIYKYDDLSQLSIWGIVYTQASGTGFAMEFIGDMHDSTTGGSTVHAVPSRMHGCGHGSGSAGCISRTDSLDLTTAKGQRVESNQPRPGRGIN